MCFPLNLPNFLILFANVLGRIIHVKYFLSCTYAIGKIYLRDLPSLLNIFKWKLSFKKK